MYNQNYVYNQYYTLKKKSITVINFLSVEYWIKNVVSENKLLKKIKNIELNKIIINNGKKNINNNQFCGDILLSYVYNNLPSSYKYFYDEEIKMLVYNYYKDDTDKYNFKFEDI